MQALYDKYLETVKDNDDTLRTIDETKYVTLENFMERTAYIEEGNSNEEG